MAKTIIVSVDRVLEVTDHLTIRVPDDFPSEGVEDGSAHHERIEEAIRMGEFMGEYPDGFRLIAEFTNETTCRELNVNEWRPR